MEPKLCIYICSAYFPEVMHVVSSGNFPDVVIKSYPYDCMNPSLTKDLFKAFETERDNDIQKTIVIAGTCGQVKKGLFPKSKSLTFYELDYCLELLFNKETIAHFIEKRYYLVTNGWLGNYRKHILNWGFQDGSEKQFFGESADKLLLLETGIPGDFKQQIEALSVYMGLPYEVLPIGLSYCRRLIETMVSQWREDNEKNLMSAEIAKISKKTADYSLVFEKMLHLVDLTDETEIVKQIFILLEILFAPKNILYKPIYSNRVGKVVIYHHDIAANPDNPKSSFSVEVIHQGLITGIFYVNDVAFSEYIERYKPMKVVIARMSGLVIANSRKYKIISDNEELLKRTEAELIELNATKDKLFSIIAHDLRGPLGAFMSFSKVLAEEHKEMTESEISEISQTMMESSNSIYLLLQNLLEWSQMQRGTADFNPEQFLLLPKIIETTRLINAPARKKSIDIKLNIADNLICFADKNMFDTVIRNLVSNAVKFTPTGGKITISASVKESFLELQIKDTGIGMSCEIVEKLFTISEKINRKGTEGESSTGLGLLLCKEFVERHNGVITVESTTGIGSVFYIRLPMKK